MVCPIQKYIKSPLNYTGGKYKLLSQIIPLFPEKIDTFIDLFGGGFNVGINVNANKIIYNDALKQTVSLIEVMKEHNLDDLLATVDYYIEKYKLSKTNKKGYLRIREDYNDGVREPIKLFTLICHSFSNQIRFNAKGDFNVPFGKRDFNCSQKNNFKDFHSQLQNKCIQLLNASFEIFDYLKITSNDFVYADPPYFNSIATYSEHNGWKESDEINLLRILDNLNGRGIRFALSNNLKYDNPILKEWISNNNYNLHYLNANYNECNYQKKNKTKDIEVLITNY